MPVFEPKHHTVEAFQWDGDYSSLPLHVQRMVELQGWRPPLVHLGDGTKIPMPESSWLIVGTDGRPEVLSNAAFQHRYQPHVVERPVLRLAPKERVKA